MGILPLQWALWQCPSKSQMYIPTDPQTPLPGIYLSDIFTRAKGHSYCSSACDSKGLETS